MISLRMPADREDHNFDHLSTCNILVNTSHMVERIVPVENGACCMLGCVLPRISKGILKTSKDSDECIQGAAAFLSSLLQDISQGCSISCSTGPAGSAHELSIGLFKTKVGASEIQRANGGEHCLAALLLVLSLALS